MAEKVRVSIVVEYEVTPGADGYETCVTASDCAAFDRAQYDDNEVGVEDVAFWGEIVSVEFVACDRKEQANG